MELPVGVKKIIKPLLAAGHEAYLVGGSVRDLLLGRLPHDHDIVTTATPDQVMELFDRVVPVGLQHGTVTVIEKGLQVEVTSIITLCQDLRRRDFTVNAMAMDLSGVIYDCFGGREDLQHQVIRAVGQAQRRFREDPLRLLRAVRQAVVLDFTIDCKTGFSIAENSYLLRTAAPERVREELNKILLSGRPARGIALLNSFDLLGQIFPEFACTEAFQEQIEHLKKFLDATPQNLSIRLAALLSAMVKAIHLKKTRREALEASGNGLNMVRLILTRLKYSKQIIEQVLLFVQESIDFKDRLSTVELKRLIGRLGYQNLDDFFNLLLAEAQTGVCEFTAVGVEACREKSKEIIDRKEAILISELAINGNDLLAMGFAPGPELGSILNHLLDMVLEKPELNNRHSLKALVRSKWRQ
ncbi:MAG: CCA tRNA nucleotidyltransferase [Pelotomaculum sp.]|jgi:tRNA nucleotidyltransferase (CCA-adding enzyme)